MARQFTKEELSMIIEDYKSGMKPFEMAQKYSRKSASIINKLKSLGIYENSNYRFTDDDVEFLRKEYPIGNWNAIKQRFPNMSRNSIVNKAYKLGIKADYYFWLENDLSYLKENYFKYTIDELEKHFNGRYSKDAIQTQAYKCFGYSTDDDWNDEENALLEKYYPTIPIDEVCEMIPTRSKNAIISHARILNLYSFFYNSTYWNEELDKILVDNWEHMSDEELSVIIGKPKLSIMERRHRLHLMRVHKDSLKYSDISKYLRGQLQDWKNKSMESCNYECVLTSSKDFQIHHLYSFSQIVSDFFSNNPDFEIKKFTDYTQEELNKITCAFIAEHDKHPLGVCVRKDLHDLFHNMYGRSMNTPEQWAKFVEHYRNSSLKNTA